MPNAFLFLSLRKLSWLHLCTFLRGNNQVRYSITCPGLHLAKSYKLGTSIWSLNPARTLTMVGWNYSPDGDYLFHRHNPLATRQKNKMTHPVDYKKRPGQGQLHQPSLLHLPDHVQPLRRGRKAEGYIGEELIFRDSGNLASINEGPA